MLSDIDRILLAVPDAERAARAWTERVQAHEVRRDRIDWLGGRRIVLRAGSGDIEIIEPDGAGLIADELARRGRAHMFAAGAASPDPRAVMASAARAGAACEERDGRCYVTVTIEDKPIRFVISAQEERQRAGLLGFFYEATVLARDQARAVDVIARTFALERAHFTGITSEAFGYTGVLTLFMPGRLPRFEVITPTDFDKTLGRFYRREGCCFYMAFAESADIALIEKRAPVGGVTVDRPPRRRVESDPDQLWLHPTSLEGMMLGVSRPTMAWKWSGSPERVEAIDA